MESLNKNSDRRLFRGRVLGIHLVKCYAFESENIIRQQSAMMNVNLTVCRLHNVMQVQYTTGCGKIK